MFPDHTFDTAMLASLGHAAELDLARRIFQSLKTSVSIADANDSDLPLIYVNPAFEHMTGYTLEEVRGLNCRFLQGDDRDQPTLKLVRHCLKTQSESIVVLRNYRKDGTPFWNELALSPIQDSYGRVTHFVGIQNDVSTRVEAESRLRESEKLAAVGRLTASIAHEINNPLEAITNLIYLAQQTTSAEETNKYLHQADGELKRLRLISSRSLRFSKQSRNPQLTNPSELLDTVLALNESRFNNHSITIRRREHPAQSIVCIESEIRQVLNNLISNAIDAMSVAGGQLSVRIRNATDWRSGRDGILMTLADTGCGMTRDTQNAMYKAFFTTKGTKGTGLGLWISGEIVDRHEGYLKVRSSTGPRHAGTLFEFFLPLEYPGNQSSAVS
jgi:two-component system, sporulation sensor kinase C